MRISNESAKERLEQLTQSFTINVIRKVITRHAWVCFWMHFAIIAAMYWTHMRGWEQNMFKYVCPLSFIVLCFLTMYPYTINKQAYRATERLDSLVLVNNQVGISSNTKTELYFDTFIDINSNSLLDWEGKN